MCVDATAELADFSCGDAWLPRFLKTGSPWSIIMTRSGEATEIVESMEREKSLSLKDVSDDEIKESQRGNLLSKKTRQAARRRLFGSIGFALPEFDGGFPPSHGGEMREAKVLATGSITYVLERIGLYPAFAKLLRRY